MLRTMKCWLVAYANSVQTYSVFPNESEERHNSVFVLVCSKAKYKVPPVSRVGGVSPVCRQVLMLGSSG